MIVVIATLVGIVAGLRAMTAPAGMSWAAYFGWLPLQNTYLSFLGFAATPYLLTALAIAELISDQLPKTPSRKPGNVISRRAPSVLTSQRSA